MTTKSNKNTYLLNRKKNRSEQNRETFRQKRPYRQYARHDPPLPRLVPETRAGHALMSVRPRFPVISETVGEKGFIGERLLPFARSEILKPSKTWTKCQAVSFTKVRVDRDAGKFRSALLWQ